MKQYRSTMGTSHNFPYKIKHFLLVDQSMTQKEITTLSKEQNVNILDVVTSTHWYK